MKRYIKYFVALAIIVLSVSSCKSTKSVAYFQNAETVKSKIESGEYMLKLIPSDVIDVTISSLIPQATDAYRLVPAPENGLDFNPKTQYVINESGEINVPTIGKVKVAGMTTTQLEDFLRGEVAKNVSDPIVKVQLTSFRVNVLGEVRNPGAKTAKTERYTILDAIADAGDLTLYGMRNNVMLIREEDGERRFHTIDLTDANLLNSPYFYLKQNDVIYVEPDKVRVINSEYNQNNSYKLSIASAVISAASVIASLIIALTIK